MRRSRLVLVKLQIVVVGWIDDDAQRISQVKLRPYVLHTLVSGASI